MDLLDTLIRTAKSGVVLVCMLDNTLLPWDAQTLRFIENGNWQGLALFLAIEQGLIFANRKMNWVALLAQMMSAVGVQTYIQWKNARPAATKILAPRLMSLSTILAMILNAANNAGTVVLASDISRTNTFGPELWLKLLGLGGYTATVVLYDSLGEIPLWTRFRALSKRDFTLLTAFVLTRLCTASLVQSMIVAVTSQGDLRMLFQRVGFREGFDMDQLIPEFKGDEKARALLENRPKLTANFTFAATGLWATVTIIRACF